MPCDPFIAPSSVPRLGVSLTGAAQAVADATPVTMSFNAEQWDTDGFIAVTATTVTVPTGKQGLYIISLTISWSTSALGTLPYASVIVSGTVRAADAGSSPTGLHAVSFCRYLSVGDTIIGQAYQNSGGSVNATPALIIQKICD